MGPAQFDQVSVIKKSNVYFDGKCVSHTVLFADGSKKQLGLFCLQHSLLIRVLQSAWKSFPANAKSHAQAKPLSSSVAANPSLLMATAALKFKP